MPNKGQRLNDSSYMASGDNGRASNRTRSDQKRHPRWETPNVWIKEIAGDHPTPPLVWITISWNPDIDPKRLRDEGININELIADFREGFSIRKREDTKGGLWFDAVSSQFNIRLRAFRAKNTGVVAVRFCGCRRHEKITPPIVLRGKLTFAAIWDEVECDLNLLVRKAEQFKREYNLYESDRTKAAAILKEPPVAATDALAELLHNRLDSLVNLLELLARFFKDRPTQTFFGTIRETIRTGAMSDDEPNDDRRLGIVMQRDAAKVDSRTLQHECIIEIRGADAGEGAWIRGTVKSATTRNLEVKLFQPGKFSAGQRVEIQHCVRFDRKNHQIALQALLEKKTHGHWPALARLMVDPKQLPAPTGDPPGHWFNDRLNAEQKQAVTGAVNAPCAFFIQGPPGTGKSTVISEIVQHLAARGERVLLVAPTHVAVDAVLEKIGDAPNIFAVRLARKEEDISPDCRRFHHLNVHKNLVKSVRSSESSLAADWNRRLDQNRIEEEGFLDLKRTLEQRAGVIQEKKQRNEQLVQLNTALEAIKKTEVTLADELAGRTVAMERANATLKREEAGAWWGSYVLAYFNWNDLGRARRAYDKAEVDRKTTETALMTARSDHKNAELALNLAEKELPIWMEEANRKLEQLTVKFNKVTESLKHHSESGPVAGVAHADDSFTSNGISERLQQLRIKQIELEKLLELEQAWLETTSAVSPEETGRQLLRAANLICATTVAIGSDPKIKGTQEHGVWKEGEWGDFDTLIVDEASRVTDAEFLIGAVRSRRWILVGDEHQLPPYVEQVEEHFLHALAALFMAEQGDAPDVDTAIKKLESWWEEDEELRQFRRESVLEQVAALLDLKDSDGPEDLGKRIELARKERLYQGGTWATQYRGLITNLAASIELSNDKEKHRSLMKLMIQFMVHSLFERCLSELGPESQLCQKLVVQRRMLGSLAKLVRDPIYGGNYISPEEIDLRHHGLTPFGFSPPFDADVVFLDTSAQKFPFHRNSGSGFVNDLECDWIITACRRLDEELFGRTDCKSVSVTILCFYQAQVEQVRLRVQTENDKEPFKVLNLFDQNSVRVVTIDRIQGQESDIVFISFVRTCKGFPKKGFGTWLQDYRRLNVACTRAHRMLVLAGHRRTLEAMGKNSDLEKAREFYQNLFSRLEGHQDDAGKRYHIVKHL